MMDSEGGIRLSAHNKLGILRIFFSRFILIFLFLVAQVFLYITLFGWLEKYIPYYAVLEIIFAYAMVIYLFNNRMDASAKLTWLAVIALVPLFGVALLAFTTSNLGHRRTRKRVEEMIKLSEDAVTQDSEVIEKLKGDPYGTDDLVKYLNRSGDFPIFTNTEVTYFPLGEDKFKALLEELEKAEKFIFLEYFIIEEGYMWGQILEVLARKAAEGVDVRVMYDGMCEITLLPHDYPKRLATLGIRAKMFAPIAPFLSSHYNNRDHRKILVIDGKVAFNGGVNLADEYINHKKLFGHWKDTAVMLKGEAVRSFTLMFLQMWNLTEPEPSFDPKFLEPTGYPETEGFVAPYGDCPLDEDKVGEIVYMDILNRATDYVYFMTPYLILDGELLTALKYAAERGVDVRLILPGIPDKKLAYALAKSHYSELTDSGVKIYEYTQGFVHAKVCVSDGKRAVVGTINLDYRSLYHHFECATYLYKVPCIADIVDDFNDTLSKCREVTKESIAHENIAYKVIGALLKFIAPLL